MEQTLQSNSIRQFNSFRFTNIIQFYPTAQSATKLMFFNAMVTRPVQGHAYSWQCAAARVGQSSIGLSCFSAQSSVKSNGITSMDFATLRSGEQASAPRPPAIGRAPALKGFALLADPQIYDRN